MIMDAMVAYSSLTVDVVNGAKPLDRVVFSAFIARR